MTANPRPRPALKKAPNDGHPADIVEPLPKSDAATQAPTKPPKPIRLHTALGKGSTSDTLRGKGKKAKKSTLRDSETVDLTVEIPRALRRRLRATSKATGLSVDEYLSTLLEITLPE